MNECDVCGKALADEKMSQEIGHLRTCKERLQVELAKAREALQGIREFGLGEHDGGVSAESKMAYEALRAIDESVALK